MAVALGSRIAFGPLLKNVRYLKVWQVPPKAENVDLEPSQRRLVPLDRIPTYPVQVRPPKVPKELQNIRGER